MGDKSRQGRKRKRVAPCKRPKAVAIAEPNAASSSSTTTTTSTTTTSSSKKRNENSNNSTASTDPVLSSCSSKKLLKKAKIASIDNPEYELGNAMVNFDLLATIISKLLCPECLDPGMVTALAELGGLAQKMTLRCQTCGYSLSQDLSNTLIGMHVCSRLVTLLLVL